MNSTEIIDSSLPTSDDLVPAVVSDDTSDEKDVIEEEEVVEEENGVEEEINPDAPDSSAGERTAGTKKKRKRKKKKKLKLPEKPAATPGYIQVASPAAKVPPPARAAAGIPPTPPTPPIPPRVDEGASSSLSPEADRKRPRRPVPLGMPSAEKEDSASADFGDIAGAVSVDFSAAAEEDSGDVAEGGGKEDPAETETPSAAPKEERSAPICEEKAVSPLIKNDSVPPQRQTVPSDMPQKEEKLSSQHVNDTVFPPQGQTMSPGISQKEETLNSQNVNDTVVPRQAQTVPSDMSDEEVPSPHDLSRAPSFDAVDEYYSMRNTGMFLREPIENGGSDDGVDAGSSSKSSISVEPVIKGDHNIDVDAGTSKELAASSPNTMEESAVDILKVQEFSVATLGVDSVLPPKSGKEEDSSPPQEVLVEDSVEEETAIEPLPSLSSVVDSYSANVTDMKHKLAAMESATIQTHKNEKINEEDTNESVAIPKKAALDSPAGAGTASQPLVKTEPKKSSIPKKAALDSPAGVGTASQPLVKAGPKKSSSRSKPEKFVHDPNQYAIKFIFAGKDGLGVICKTEPSTSIGEVKAILLSMWPEVLPPCSQQDRIRLVCMGKGMLSPNSRTLLEYNFPVFKTHPTPVNVSVKPEAFMPKDVKPYNDNKSRNFRDGNTPTNIAVDSRCLCIIS